MERSYFYDSVTGDQRIYNAADFARFHSQIIGTGVSNTEDLPDLSVSAKQNMVVTLGAGFAFANGYMYENSEGLDLTHAIADATNDRIDRVVIRFDNNPANRNISAIVKQGTPAASPVAPALQRDSYVYELSVAQVRIIKGKSFIGQSSITDERAVQAVCGYIPLHNIYRGMNVSNDGIVTLPNQSYVDVRHSVASSIDYVTRQTSNMAFGTINSDKQNEVIGNTFVPKADGIYYLWLMVRSSGILPAASVGQDIQYHLKKNGVAYNYPFLSHVPATKDDNIYIGSMVEALSAGDVMEIYGALYLDNQPLSITDTWLRIAKLS